MRNRVYMAGVLAGMLLCTGSAHAATSEIEALLVRVRELTAEVARLSVLLDAQESLVVTSVHSLSDLAPSRFYDGTYAALYEVHGLRLVPIAPTKVHPVDVAVWERFVRIAGESFVRVNVREFRVYEDPDAEYDAFTELDPQIGTWMIGFNVYGIDLSTEYGRREIDTLLLHEFGHMLIDADTALYTAHYDRFWDAASYVYDDPVARYSEFPSDFVSEYAAESPLEDMVESFVAFVREPGYSGETIADQKRNFFFAYPAFIGIRDRIRSL